MTEANYDNMVDGGPTPDELVPVPKTTRDPLAASPDMQPKDVGQALDLAKAMAASTVVPSSLQKDVDSCLLVVMDAVNRGVNPITHAQSRYVVHGSMGVSGSGIIAEINRTGRFEGVLQFSWDGEDDDLACTAAAKERATGAILSYTFRLSTAVAQGWAKPSKPMWKNEPELMLAYRAATRFATLYCPEAALGIDLSEGAHASNDTSQDAARAAELTQKYGRQDRGLNTTLEHIND